jgi:hypothetical protein
MKESDHIKEQIKKALSPLGQALEGENLEKIVQKLRDKLIVAELHEQIMDKHAFLYHSGEEGE